MPIMREAVRESVLLVDVTVKMWERKFTNRFSM